MDVMTNLRNQIDTIDDQIMELLNKRYDIALEIGIQKALTNNSILDQNRETIILEKASKYSHSPQIKVVYETIMSESRSLQRK